MGLILRLGGRGCLLYRHRGGSTRRVFAGRCSLRLLDRDVVFPIGSVRTSVVRAVVGCRPGRGAVRFVRARLGRSRLVSLLRVFACRRHQGLLALELSESAGHCPLESGDPSIASDFERQSIEKLIGFTPLGQLGAALEHLSREQRLARRQRTRLEAFDDGRTGAHEERLSCAPETRRFGVLVPADLQRLRGGDAGFRWTLQPELEEREPLERIEVIGLLGQHPFEGVRLFARSERLELGELSLCTPSCQSIDEHLRADRPLRQSHDEVFEARAGRLIEGRLLVDPKTILDGVESLHRGARALRVTGRAFGESQVGEAFDQALRVLEQTKTRDLECPRGVGEAARVRLSDPVLETIEVETLPARPSGP